MATTSTTKRAARSGNPATKAQAKADAAASRKAQIEADEEARRLREEAKLRAQEEFRNLVLPEPELDDDGYEIIPDKSKLEGNTYKFKVGGQPYELPNLQYLPVELALGGKTEDEVNAAVFGRYAPDLFAYASADQLRHIMKRWQSYSAGVGLGE